MWRIATCVYRSFRNTATHRCAQDVLIPLTTVCHSDDDDEANANRLDKCSSGSRFDIDYILKNNQFSHPDIDKLQKYLTEFSIQQLSHKEIVGPSIDSIKSECAAVVVQSIPVPPSKPAEETLESLVQADDACVNTVKDLSNVHEEIMSAINLELGIDALECGNVSLGIDALRASAKTGANAAAFYNLGICYERGLGVEEDRAKACDYYRQASKLGHVNAQFNLTLLSNQIDFDENEDEASEQPTPARSPHVFLHFSLPHDCKEEPSRSEYHQFEFRNSTVACL